MTHTTRKIIAAAAVFAACLSHSTAQRLDRLPAGIGGESKVKLHGSMNPRVEALASAGPVEDSMPVTGISFRFKPTESQQADLDQLLEDQQDPWSPLYHAWLTPEEYGNRFGLSAADYAKVHQWIESQGFQVDATARSRTWITFSGTAAQVRQTFLAGVHRFQVNGNTHYANVSEAALPAELEPLVYNVRGLDDFRMEKQPRLRPQINYGKGEHGVVPGDLAVIYNLKPVHDKGITGAGQKIVVAGQTSFNMSDVREFRSRFGLPANDPRMILVPGLPDPGITGDVREALLDVQYAGASAPGAAILYVYSQDTRTSVEYAIDRNLAPVISLSYGGCEQAISGISGAAADLRNMGQQANAQGITWVAASGDTGPSGCESQMRDKVGLSISAAIPASLPEVTAVGGTTFAEKPGVEYWDARNSETLASALSYIPETGWNDTAAEGKLAASGGGPSVLYTRPAWQTGPGVPHDNARHLPDIALAASWNHDPYVVSQNGELSTAGGTSAATAYFAGVVALLNQHVMADGKQSRPGLGNINPRLYQLAQSAPSVFHDTTAGDNMIPCATTAPGCTGGRFGFQAGLGYDHVTGLGSIDGKNLVENWIDSKPDSSASSVVPSVDPNPVVRQEPDEEGYDWRFTLRLRETAGAATTVTSFSIDGQDLSGYIADWFGSRNLAANGSLSVELRTRDLAAPANVVFAFGGVDGGGKRWSREISVPFLPAGSQAAAAMSLTSNPAVVVKLGKGDPNCSPEYPFGQVLELRELNGVEVQLTKFFAGGFDFSAQIGSWFGSARLPAKGALSARMCWQLERTPVTLSYQVDGIDASGKPVQATLKVDFKSFDAKSGDSAPAAVSVASRFQPKANRPPALPRP